MGEGDIPSPYPRFICTAYVQGKNEKNHFFATYANRNGQYTQTFNAYYKQDIEKLCILTNRSLLHERRKTVIIMSGSWLNPLIKALRNNGVFPCCAFSALFLLIC